MHPDCRRPTLRALRCRVQRGVSLVEAIVAMAVMAFGMLAIVGLQTTLRLNSDVAKQRAEAVRIAQEAIEEWRAFSVMGATAGSMAYADIVSELQTDVLGLTTNTTYRLSRFENDEFGQIVKSVRVVVEWSDRANNAQSVELNSIIARVDPALSGTLSIRPSGVPVRQPLGRNPAIPVGARDMLDKTSAFKPPGAGGAVLWVFDNLEGVIVGVCNNVTTELNDLTQDNTQMCVNSTRDRDLRGLPLTGFVRFSTGSTQPTAVNSENPTSPALNLAVELALTGTGHPSPNHVCYVDAPTSATTTRTAVRYYCAIFFNVGVVPRWSGISTLTPLAFLEPDVEVAWVLAADGADANATRYRVCRYTPATSDTQVIPNQLHPRNYSNVTALQPLTNQNFLVIRAGNGDGTPGNGTAFNCPTDVPANPAAGDYVNSNTLPHQPPPATP
jgi:hypothetical protein